MINKISIILHLIISVFCLIFPASHRYTKSLALSYGDIWDIIISLWFDSSAVPILTNKMSYEMEKHEKRTLLAFSSWKYKIHSILVFKTK